MSVVARNNVKESTTKSWSYTVVGAALPAWVIIADSSNNHIDIKPVGRGMVYIRPDEQDAFQRAYDDARLWLAKQEDQS